MSKGINPNLKKLSRTIRPLGAYLDGLKDGNRFILSEVLTLVESTQQEQRKMGEAILNKISDFPQGASIRIGITGSPGSGKSTFIEALGTLLLQKGKKVAVLAIDPSSTRTHGSILGDKTRMSSLSTNPNAFIRPTASSAILGGVARATKESIALCEATGYDVIIVESVGVGQSETELANLVDLYLLLLLPGGGDGVQGIKRGVVELADIIIVNKNDGERIDIAALSKKDFSLAVRLFHHELENWNVPVELCSSIENTGLENIWARVSEFIELSQKNNFIENKRLSQNDTWLRQQVLDAISDKAETLFDFSALISQESSSSSVFERLQVALQKVDKNFSFFMKLKKNS